MARRCAATLPLGRPFNRPEENNFSLVRISFPSSGNRESLSRLKEKKKKRKNHRAKDRDYGDERIDRLQRKSSVNRTRDKIEIAGKMRWVRRSMRGPRRLNQTSEQRGKIKKEKRKEERVRRNKIHERVKICSYPRRSNVVPLDGSPIDLGTPAKGKRKRGYSIYPGDIILS